MNIDIIGSSFTKKLTEFKNFPFKINNALEGQSLLSLFSEPYPIEMSELNTVDLTEITTAYRDFNKTHLTKMKESESEILLIELTSELNDICFLNDSYFNASSLSLVPTPPVHWTLARIQKFRAFAEMTDSFVQFASKYDKVILLKIDSVDKQDTDFLNALYTLIENRLHNILIHTVPEFPENKNMENVPLEYFNEINASIRKFQSKNYYDQLLFDEKLKNNQLSVFINYLEDRIYIYDLYKNGHLLVSSEQTLARTYNYELEEPGKYRIRVNPVGSDVNPRFTATYEFSEANDVTKTIKYLELPHDKIDWKINFLTKYYNLSGLVGNPYLYPDGYNDLPVYLMEEIKNDNILYSDQILDHIFLIIEKMDASYIKDIFNQIGEDKNDRVLEFLKYKVKNADG